MAPSVPPGGRVSFSATVTGTANTAVTWAVSESAGCGTVLADGAYTAPGADANCHVVATAVADPLKSATANVNVVSTTGGTPRPAYNTGVGFFTLNGKIYDANGNEFHIKGADTCHWDEAWTNCSSNCGLPNAKFNTNRMFLPVGTLSTAQIQGPITKMISQGIVPMPAMHWTGTADLTCQNSIATFNTAVSQWVAKASVLKPYERHILINIANEWGSSGSTAWRDAYLSAVASLRAAGYLNTLVIDAPDCGKDPQSILNYGQAIYNSDPQHNIIFSVHIYDMFTYVGAQPPDDRQYEINAISAQLAATGLPIIFGEFGPKGLNNTPLTPGQIITAANDHGIGWIGWAWDDGTGEGWFGMTNNKAFSLAGGVPSNGSYPNNSDLTRFGNEVILNPTFGTFSNAVPATVFP
jgi:Cellulase (glycosyl hydrolase family 5)